MRNVFVLCAGRTASTAFAAACSHFTNYTAGHETRATVVGASRLDYPQGHIEIDNRLAWFLGGLDERYGDDAYYVYLTRDLDAVARSYLNRWHLTVSIVRAFAQGILMKRDISASERLDICRHYAEAVDQNIRCFLKDKPNVKFIRLESIQDEFEQFMAWIDAQGDTKKALEEWQVRHNLNKKPGIKRIAIAALRKVQRAMISFPGWLRSV